MEQRTCPAGTRGARTLPLPVRREPGIRERDAPDSAAELREGLNQDGGVQPQAGVDPSREGGIEVVHRVEAGMDDGALIPVLLAHLGEAVLAPQGVAGLVNGAGKTTQRLAQGLRLSQTGYARTYALAVLLGAVGLLVYFLFMAG